MVKDVYPLRALGADVDLSEYISIDPDIVHGQPRIKGTRIPVSQVLDCLAPGMTESEIMGQFPTLTQAGIRAAAAYAATLVRDEEILPLIPAQG